MTDSTLLPPLLAAEKHFQALATQAARLQQIDLTPLLVYLLDMTEASALPWLAEQLALTGVNGWSLAESDDARRAMLKSAITLRRWRPLHPRESNWWRWIIRRCRCAITIKRPTTGTIIMAAVNSMQKNLINRRKQTTL